MGARGKRWGLIAAVTVAAGVLLLTLAGGALAATITVTTTADDNTPNDGSVSLREAIQAINNGGPGGDPDIVNTGAAYGTNDTINFDISSSGVRQTIAVGSSGLGALPAITQLMTINGYSEPKASPNTLANGDNASILIAIEGSNAGPSADGFRVQAFSTLKGLDIFDFSLNQIELLGGSVVAGNDIGFDTIGAPTRSSNDGVRITGAILATIGGTTPAARNVISGNIHAGVHIATTGVGSALNNVVEGNFIGTDPSGKAADGNARFGAGTVDQGGVEISGGDYNTIGGSNPAAGNVISGNGAGIDIDDGSQNNIVQGNLIGVGADGVTPVPNLGYGVDIRSSDNLAPPLGPGQANEPPSAGNIIGLNPNTGFSGLGNVIANNGGDGVRVDDSVLPNNATPIANTGNSILGNSISSNATTVSGALGIDLKGGSGSIFPNNRMTAPSITAVTPAASPTVVAGTLTRAASPNMKLRIELFSSPKCDAGGAGEGQTLIGAVNTTTGSSGNASFSANVTPLAPGQIVTATATNTSADPSAQTGSVNVFNTSQFSSCFRVPAAPPVAISTPTGGTPTGGTGTGGTATPTSCPAGEAGTPPNNCLPPPSITKASEQHRVWRRGNRGATFARRRRPPVGTTFSFVLSQPARVSFAFTNSVRGRSVRGKCVAQTKRNRGKRACSRTVVAGRLAFNGHTGLNKVTFQGRLPGSKKLAPASYTLTITAVNAVGESAKPQALRFAIVK